MMNGTGGKKELRRHLTGWLLVGLAVAVTAPACATKRDIRDMRTETLALRAHQDSLFREVQRQNRLLLDTLRSSFTIQQDAAGQTSHRFQQLEEQLRRTEELMYQLQVLVADVVERLDRQPVAQTQSWSSTAVDSTGAPIVTADSGEAGRMYDSGMEQIGQGAYTTARFSFQQVIEQFPNHPLAASAQWQIGQAYIAEGDNVRAIEELERIEAMWPGSPRAPEGLLQAGSLAEGLNDIPKAKALYSMIRSRYPATEQYREATRRFNALGG
jgi:tol-pal system protein YbgF